MDPFRSVLDCPTSTRLAHRCIAGGQLGRSRATESPSIEQTQSRVFCSGNTPRKSCHIQNWRSTGNLLRACNPDRSWSIPGACKRKHGGASDTDRRKGWRLIGSSQPLSHTSTPHISVPDEIICVKNCGQHNRNQSIHATCSYDSSHRSIRGDRRTGGRQNHVGHRRE